MKRYLVVRDWVDGCLAGPRSLKKVEDPVVLPLSVTGLLVFSVSRSRAAVIIFILVAFVWLTFVSWRGWRLGKADALKRDRRERKRPPMEADV